MQSVEEDDGAGGDPRYSLPRVVPNEQDMISLLQPRTIITRFRRGIAVSEIKSLPLKTEFPAVEHSIDALHLT